jgi:hypothetical protein
LSPNKQAVEDLGIDFFCQVLTPMGTGSEEVTGRAIVVQVRATTCANRPRIKLYREDIETALRQETPYCLIGVDMPTRRVHFKFLDGDLAKQWSAFLEGSNKSTSVRIDEMSSDSAQFQAELHHLTRPTSVMKLAHTRIRLAINRDIPGADLRLNAGAARDWALLAMPLLGRAFDVPDIAVRDALTNTVFRLDSANNVYDEAVRRFALKSSINLISNLTDGNIFLAAGLEADVALVLHNEQGDPTANARLRHAADERAYLLECGLILKVSDARKHSDGTPVHELSFELKSDGAASLGTTTDLSFLKGLTPGATLNLANRSGIPIESFGIQHLATSVSAIEKVCEAVDVPLV